MLIQSFFKFRFKISKFQEATYTVCVDCYREYQEKVEIFTPTKSLANENFNLFFLRIEIEIFGIPISIFCDECHREYLEKVWLKKNPNYGRSSVLKLSLP